MKQTSYLNETLAKDKALYEKPTMQVYEFEIEGNILLEATSKGTTIDDYEIGDELS